MKKSVFHSIALLVRLALGGAFIVAAIFKLRDIPSFVATIHAFEILPQSLETVFAYALIGLEIILGVMLIFDIPGGLSGITLLLLIFIAVVGYGLYAGLEIDCGCFGAPADPWAAQTAPKAESPLWSTLYRDLLMLAGAVYLLIWKKVAR